MKNLSNYPANIEQMLHYVQHDSNVQQNKSPLSSLSIINIKNERPHKSLWTASLHLKKQLDSQLTFQILVVFFIRNNPKAANECHCEAETRCYKQPIQPLSASKTCEN